MQPAMREKMQRNVSQTSWLIAPSDYLQTLTSSLRMSAVSQRCNVIGDRLLPARWEQTWLPRGWANCMLNLWLSHWLLALLPLGCQMWKSANQSLRWCHLFLLLCDFATNSRVLDSIIRNMYLIISMSLYKKYFHSFLFQKGHHSGINFTPNVPDAVFPIPRFGSLSIIKQRLVHS